MKQTKLLIKEIIEVLGKPVMSVLPGHLSFFLLLSSIPIILIFGMVASAFSLSYDEILKFISLSLPATTSKLILPLFTGKTMDFSVILLAISAIYLASRGTKAIIAAANNIYGVKKNPIQDTIKSLIITLLLIVLLIFIVFILVFGNKIISIIGVIPQIGFIGSKILSLINLMRWPISFFIIFLFIKMIYTLTPNKKISSKSVNKGSLFTTLLWIILTYIYSFYVTNYASYNDYYGSASNILVLMLWIFIISEVFVIGMIMNSIEDRKLNGE
jgi:membrane protein